jgi:hypothetical protein
MASIDFSQLTQSDILHCFNTIKAELASRDVDSEVPCYWNSGLRCYLINIDLKTDVTGTSSFPNQHHLLPDTLLESFPSAPTSLRPFSPPDNMSMAQHNKADIEDNNMDDHQDAVDDADATSIHDAATDTAMIRHSEQPDDNLFNSTVVPEVETQSKIKGKGKAKDQVVQTLTAATYI